MICLWTVNFKQFLFWGGTNCFVTSQTVQRNDAERVWFLFTKITPAAWFSAQMTTSLNHNISFNLRFFYTVSKFEDSFYFRPSFEALLSTRQLELILITYVIKHARAREEDRIHVLFIARTIIIPQLTLPQWRTTGLTLLSVMTV